MPRTLKPAPTKRAKAPRARGNVFATLEPKILSAEEKHELIRAHTEARAGQDRGFHAGYIVAIAASTLMVMTGWLMSFGRGIWLTKPPVPDPAVETIQQTATEVRDDIKTFKTQVDGLKDQPTTTTTK
ncbi:MAG: hypothetical protein U0487_01890 [Patescibacteria group bacterium]